MLLESELTIKTVCVVRKQRPAPDRLEIGMPKNRFHQHFRKALPSVVGMDHHVAEIREYRIIGHEPSHAALTVGTEDAKSKRMLNRFSDDIVGTQFRPTGQMH